MFWFPCLCLCVFTYLQLPMAQVLDLLIQRILELPEVASQSLEKLLEKYGPLYKFHGTQYSGTSE